METEDELPSEAETPLARFFMEPRTRRLTTVASVIQCSSPTVPHYKNRQDSWIAIDRKKLYPAVTPIVLGVNHLSRNDVPLGKNFNWQDAGIYNKEVLANWEKFSTTPQAAKGKIGKIIRFGSSRPPGSRPELDEYFPGAPSYKIYSSFSFSSYFWNIVAKYGQICSIILGTGLLVRFFTWVTGVLFRLCSAPVTGSVFNHVASAFFPSARDFLRDNWLRGSSERQHQDKSVADAAAASEQKPTPPPSPTTSTSVRPKRGILRFRRGSDASPEEHGLKKEIHRLRRQLRASAPALSATELQPLQAGGGISPTPSRRSLRAAPLPPSSELFEEEK